MDWWAWAVTIIQAIFMAAVIHRLYSHKHDQQAKINELGERMKAEAKRQLDEAIAKNEEKIERRVRQELIFFRESLYETHPN